MNENDQNVGDWLEAKWHDARHKERPSVRLLNVLRFQIKPITVGQLREGMLKGEINPIKHWRNMGRESTKELCKWLKIPLPALPAKQVRLPAGDKSVIMEIAFFALSNQITFLKLASHLDLADEELIRLKNKLNQILNHGQTPT